MEIENFNNYIKENAAVTVYFSGEYCSVCQVLKPKIHDAISENFPKMNFLEIKTEQFPKTCAELKIFSIPTILVYLDGKEFAKYGRNISIAQFIENTKRPYELFFEERV